LERKKRYLSSSSIKSSHAGRFDFGYSSSPSLAFRTSSYPEPDATQLKKIGGKGAGSPSIEGTGPKKYSQ